MFGFNPVEYKTYKRNFLKTVTVQFLFPEILSFNEKLDSIESLFIKDFPKKDNSIGKSVEIKFNNDRTPIVNKRSVNNGLLLKSSDGNKAINLTKDSFTLTINGKVYKDFSTIESCLSNLDQFIEKTDIQKIERFSIRKLNIAEFNLSGDANAIEIMTYLLNPDLIGNLNYFPSSEKIVNNLQTLNYKDNENALNIKYGLIIPSHLEEIGQVIFDIDLICHRTIDSNELKGVGKNVNSEIFNIFSWLISENTKKFLNEEY